MNLQGSSVGNERGVYAAKPFGVDKIMRGDRAHVQA